MKSRLILGIVCALILSVASAAKKAAPTPAELAPTHGYVFVLLPKGMVGPEATLSLRRIGEKKDQALVKRPDVPGDALGAWLPAGEYAISKIGIFQRDEYPPVTVKAGQITDLGSFVPFTIGSDKFAVLPLRPKELSARVQVAIDEYAAALVSTDVLRWVSPAMPKPINYSGPSTGLGLVADLLMAYDRKVNRAPLRQQLSEMQTVEEFVALAKTAMPPLNDRPAVHSDGTLYFGADVGQVRVRKPDATWASLDTGTIDAISAVAVDGDRLIAGSKRGMMFSSSNRGTDWTQLPALPTTEAVASIARAGSRWIIVTLHPTLDRNNVPTFDHFKLYASDQDDLSSPKLLREHKLDPAQAFWIWKGPSAQAFGENVFISAVPDLLRINASSLEITKITPPSAVHGFSVSRSDGLLSAYVAAGAFSKLFLSSDAGANWKKLRAPPYVIDDIHFDDPTTGRAVRGRMGAFSVTRELLDYDAAQDKWKANGDAPDGCVRMLNDAARRPVFCLTNGGSVLRRNDADWVVEFAAE